MGAVGLVWCACLVLGLMKATWAISLSEPEDEGKTAGSRWTVDILVFESIKILPKNAVVFSMFCDTILEKLDLEYII